MKFKWLLIFAIVFFLGCATTSKQVSSGVHVDYKTEIIKKPPIEGISKVNIGESIVSTYKKQIIPTLILKNDLFYVGKFNGFDNRFHVHKGELKLTKQNGQGQFFSAENKITISVDAIGSTQYVDGGIFLYNDQSKAAIFLIQKYSGKCRIQPIPNDKIAYEVIKKEVWSDDSFNRELVYTGKSGNTISILYREFIDNMARPAFSQEIKYDLTDTKIIGYKNARFKVVEADNVSLKYETLKHLK